MRALIEVDPDVEDGVYYPSEDGEPMGETGIHVAAIIALVPQIKDLFKDRPDVYVATDMFWYWEKGVPASCCAPDIMVIPGVGNHERYSFRSWNEGGAVPAVIFEMASKKTWKRNLGFLYTKFERLGVKEYFIFDPEEKFVKDPPLRGFRLRKKKYEAIRAGKDGSLWSGQLKVRVVQQGQKLRLIDPETGEFILTHAEQAEQERQRAEQERQRADQERQRADALEADNVRLRAQLANKGKSNGPKPGK